MQALGRQRRPEARALIGQEQFDRLGEAALAAPVTAGHDRETAALRDILAGTAPVVVDAGALDLAHGATAPTLLTPHAGEFARLCELLELPGTGDRAADAQRVASEIGATVLLKGARTLIAAPDGDVIEVAAGTGWLATAGTGDVLAGILGALLAANPGSRLAANPGSRLAETAAAGVWLHGRAARLAAGASDGTPGHPIVALDVAEALPHAIAELLT